MSSVRRSLQILELIINADQPMSHAQIAERLRIPKSTLSQLLTILRSMGYVSGDQGKHYPGIQLISMGFRLAFRSQTRMSVKPLLDRLAQASGETVILGIRVHDEVMYIEQSPSPHPIRYVQEVGNLRPLHATAMGRTFMAFSNMTAASLSTLPRVTAKTITDAGELDAILERVRRDGYDINEGESVEGVSAIAAPILDEKNKPIAGINVVGPSHRMNERDMRERIWPLLRQTVEEVRAQTVPKEKLG